MSLQVRPSIGLKAMENREKMKFLTANTGRWIYLPILICCLLAPSHASATVDQEISIIPRPVSLTLGEGEFTLSPNTIVITDRETRPVGELLVGWLTQSTGYRLRLK